MNGRSTPTNGSHARAAKIHADFHRIINTVPCTRRTLAVSIQKHRLAGPSAYHLAAAIVIGMTLSCAFPAPSKS